MSLKWSLLYTRQRFTDFFSQERKISSAHNKEDKKHSSMNDQVSGIYRKP